MNIGIGIGISFDAAEYVDTGGIDFEFLSGENFIFLAGDQFELLEQV